MENNLLQYPNQWLQLLKPFEADLSKPQFANFCQATTAMAVSEHTTINRWCHLFAPKHQSSLNDFFTRSPWEEQKVHERLSKITVRNIKDAHIGILDDTLSHKPYAEKMEGLGFHYDGMTGKESKGHSIVTFGFSSRELGFVPFDSTQYLKDGRSKNDLACTIIKRAHRYRKLSLYLMDSWYANTKVLSAIKEQSGHYITEMKSNRNATINRRCRQVWAHGQYIDAKQFTVVTIKGTKYRFFQCSAFISGRGLGTVNLVFSQKYEEKEKQWGETHYLITDILQLPGARVIELYLLRGGIESFHREAKQQLGLEHYQLRNGRGIDRYLFLVLLTYVLLLLLCQQLLRKDFVERTIGELRQEVKAACYTTMLQRSKHVKRRHIEVFARELAFAL